MTAFDIADRSAALQQHGLLWYRRLAYLLTELLLRPRRAILFSDLHDFGDVVRVKGHDSPSFRSLQNGELKRPQHKLRQPQGKYISGDVRQDS